jgi:hypothetical protein
MFKDWKISGEREMFIPGRLDAQQKKQEMELERLRKLGLETPSKPMSQMPHFMLFKQQLTT